MYNPNFSSYFFRFATAAITAGLTFSSTLASASTKDLDFLSARLTIESSCHRKLMAGQPTPGESMENGKVRYRLTEQVQRTNISQLRGDRSLDKLASRFQPTYFETTDVPRKSSNWHFFIDVERDEQGQIYFTYVVEANAQQVESMRSGTHKYAVMITEGSWEGYLQGKETKFQFTPSSLESFRKEYTLGVRRGAETIRSSLNQTFASSQMQILPSDNVNVTHKHPEVFRAIDGKLVSGNPTRTLQFTFMFMAQVDDLAQQIERRLSFIEENATHGDIEATRRILEDLQLAVKLIKSIRHKTLEMENLIDQSDISLNQNSAIAFVAMSTAIQETAELKRSLREVIERLPESESDLRRAGMAATNELN